MYNLPFTKSIISNCLIISLVVVGCKKVSNDVLSDFTVSNRTPFKNELVIFENLSVNGESYQWNFGDGNTSSDANPQHAYIHEGFYTVQLESKSSVSSDVRTKERYIHVLKRELPIANFNVSKLIATAGDAIQFINLSEYAESYLWDFGDLNSSEEINPVHTYSEEGYYTVSLLSFNEFGNDEQLQECMIQVRAGDNNYVFPEGTVPCFSACQTTEIIEVLNPVTNRIWMNRNLGASRAAQSADDELSFGDLYQWGRFSDGHQCRNSHTTTFRSNSPMPWHDKFIIAGNWLQVSTDNLWQGVNGLNNPCPSGFKVPTKAEWEAEKDTWPAGNFSIQSTPLRLPLGGFRSRSTASIGMVGSRGYYWTSTAGNHLTIVGDNDNIYATFRAHGMSLRCIKQP